MCETGSIDAALTALRGEDLTVLPAARLDNEVVGAASGGATQLEAEQLRWVGEWERQGVWALDGSKSAAAALARRCGIAMGTARDRCACGARLRQAPAVAASVRRGPAEPGQGAAVGRPRGDGHRRAALGVRRRGGASWSGTPSGCRCATPPMWSTTSPPPPTPTATKPTGIEVREQSLPPRREVGRCGHLDGFLDPESTQIARHALGVIEDRLYRNEHPAAKNDDGEAE